MTSKTFVIANPRAGAIRDGRVVPSAIVPSAELLQPDTLDALRAVARRVRPEDRVVVAGGDGTFRRVVDAVIEAHGEGALPSFVVAPAGTNDTVARSLGIPRLEGLRDATLDAFAPVAFPTLRMAFRFDAGGEREIHGFTLGAGLLVDAFTQYLAAEEPGVLDGVRAVAVPLFGGIARGGVGSVHGLRAEVEGEPVLPGSLHSLLASVIDDPIRFLRPFGPRLDGRPAFHLVASGMPLPWFAASLFPIFFGTCRHPQHVLEEVRHLRLRLDEAVMIDGDLEALEGPGTADLALGPTLRVLVPGAVAEHHPPEVSVALPAAAPSMVRGVEAHVAWLTRRYGDALVMIVLIGSWVDEALRTETSIPDFFVILDDYRGAPEPAIRRASHRVLAPDLYTLEPPDPPCKYYVVDRATVWRETGPDASDLYILGRLSKRTSLVHARDAVATSLYEALARRAALSACTHAVALLDAPTEMTDLVRAALRLSYRAERRLEDERKVEALHRSATAYYATVFGACVDALVARGVAVRDGEGRIAPGPRADRAASEALLQRALVRTFLRWPKMMLTVDDWISLLQGKLERTHGIRIEVPDWERPIFLVTGWRHYVRLRREGKIR